ncbi:heat shock protein 83-like isoform X2 [Prunus yedoensis var. nudiflora]|uniref:Heat shock protein 83-like isoform X2 n=1 Tax=Prunus yedoensis var. nudiflora TaxID=2094558 RepID=A0A314ZCA5_PRUYE|nr:heat shock protein 83-like isoform X2 [Prunus yedoensis var. nudiflora]
MHGKQNQGLLRGGLHFLLCQTLSLYMASFEGISRIGYLHMQNPKEVEKDEYHEFYKKTFSELLDPVAYTHFTTEGLVDSNDIPLNVSQEGIQESRIVRIMRKRLIQKTFDMIQEIFESENKRVVAAIKLVFSSLIPLERLKIVITLEKGIT